MEKISKHLSYGEVVRSDTAKRLGINNQPNDSALPYIRMVANTIFEPLREALGGKPIAVTSFYRSVRLNKAIGGSSKSQHCKGQAVDLDADVHGGMTNSEIFNYIRYNLPFDQLIWEFGDDNEPDWVHVSLVATGNRKQCLKATRTAGGKTKYEYI